MPFGHSVLDYFVVGGTVLWTIKLLLSKPERLVLWLPLFLTIDFFIPLGAQLTPSRILPLIIGVWLLHKGWHRPMPQHSWMIGIALTALIASFGASILIDDAGTRPLFRLLHYLNLIFVFLFVVRVSRREAFLEYALWGLLLAGVCHGGYAMYQQIAEYLGLPYRGIVYSASGRSIAVNVGPFLRVNGFADEPKRLGYVLISGSLAAYYFLVRPGRHMMRLPLGRWSASFRSQTILVMAIALMGVATLMTFSGSVFIAASLTFGALVILLSVRAVVIFAPLAIVVAAAITLFPDTTNQFVEAITELSEDRIEEIELGLGANTVYRQEFYAQALIEERPMSLIQGVGLGRYNTVLRREFGPGAGIGVYGTLAPLNSQLYEVGFDVGLVGLILLYVGAIVHAFRVGRERTIEFALSTMLLFLVIQSLFIENKLYIVFVAAACSGLLHQRRIAKQSPIKSNYFLKNGPKNP